MKFPLPTRLGNDQRRIAKYQSANTHSNRFTNSYSQKRKLLPACPIRGSRIHGDVTYSMLYGYPGALNEPEQVILTEELFAKLFGDTHPIGQEIALVSNGEEKLFKVGGVFKEFNDMEMFNFDLLVNISNRSNADFTLPLKDAWKSELWTFIQVENGTDLGNLNAGFAEMVKTQNKIDPENPYLSIQLESFTDLVKNSENIERGVVSFLAVAPQILLAAIGTFILILAVFNYINISILMAFQTTQGNKSS